MNNTNKNLSKSAQTQMQNDINEMMKLYHESKNRDDEKCNDIRCTCDLIAYNEKHNQLSYSIIANALKHADEIYQQKHNKHVGDLHDDIFFAIVHCTNIVTHAMYQFMNHCNKTYEIKKSA
ncbi:MAG: hypothetical protein FWE06_03720 [Oscillospiraceae bacterium]|nr:hypothetical protein [Oscillospiraceae bacterium]